MSVRIILSGKHVRLAIHVHGGIFIFHDIFCVFVFVSRWRLNIAATGCHGGCLISNIRLRVLFLPWKSLLANDYVGDVLTLWLLHVFLCRGQSLLANLYFVGGSP